MTESSSTPSLSSSASFDPRKGPRGDLARAIPRRMRVTWWMGAALAIGFAVLVLPSVIADRLIAPQLAVGQPASVTVRVPPFAGYEAVSGRIDGGVLLARGEIVRAADKLYADELAATQPRGAIQYIALFALIAVLAGLFAHHTRRSNHGRLLRVQLFSLGAIALAAVAVKIVMLTTAISVLAVPVAVFALVPTMALDRVVGLATGTLAALVVSLLVPFDVGVAILLLVQVGTAGLVVAERPKNPLRAALVAGLLATVLTALTYPLLLYLTTGKLPTGELADPLHSTWIACAIGPAAATVLALPLLPLYQRLVGEITHGKLVELEDLSHPLLRQIADRAPGSWQHSLMMANMAELAANAIGANGRLVRVGAYFHDLGKSLQPKYFIENLQPGETSPHDQLPPRVSCDAIFSHVTEGLRTARNAGLHERIVDFMHMHHGDGVLEYFWAKCQEQGNSEGLTIEHFRYPGVPPQSRETAILAICDAVEAASRTLKKPEPAAIDQLVQRIVYGKLHLGQLDESGLSMGDLRRVADSLRDTIRHANHSRIEYPWQKAQQDASASGASLTPLVSTGPRLDSLDRPAKAEPIARAGTVRESQEAEAVTGGGATPKLRVGTASDSGAIAATAPAPMPAPGPHAQDSASPSGARAWHAHEADADDDAHDAARSRPEHTRLDGGAGRAEPPPRATPPPAPRSEPKSAEAAQFASEAAAVLREAWKELAAQPKDERAAEVPSSARKRAATIPPTPLPVRRPPTVQPPLGGRRAPTVPPSDVYVKTTLPGQLVGLGSKAPATIAGVAPGPAISSDAAITLPPVARRPAAEIVADDATTTRPRLEPAADETSSEDTHPRLDLPLVAPSSSGSSWRAGLSDRVDAAIDDDFGAETPIVAPTKAELQALLDHPPDVTRKQSVSEMEALHRKAAAERPSQPELELTRRPPKPTAEIEDADIEAAIELAPPARRTGTIGVAKKKTTE